ncbi:hypothetical protein [Candidatus Aalborgicola defluviihabitans]
MTPLRQRMLDAMTVRGLAERTRVLHRCRRPNGTPLPPQSRLVEPA